MPDTTTLTPPPVLGTTSPADASPAAAPAAVQPAGCYHCGLPIPANARPEWQVHIAGADQAMCCPGCTAVAQTIMDLGQEAYYLNRSAYAATAEGAQVLPPELQLYDNADPRFVCRDSESERETTLAVDGIRCAACVWLIEQRLNQLPGVASAQLNVATERLYVRWRSDDCRPGDILAALHTIGYTAYPYDAARHSVQQQQAQRTLGRQLFVAGLSMMQVMMYVAPAYMAEDGTLDANMAQLFRWASLLLTAPAIFYSALPFWRGAWSSLRARALGMDVPVALGIAAAFGASVLSTFQGGGEVYYDSVTMFIFLLLCSRYLELRARRKAGAALERLQHGLPASATVLADYPASQQGTLVKAAALEIDQVIMIKPGEAVAADCVILEGRTALDLSLLSGESAPIAKQVGDELPGGAINASNMIIARVTQRVQDSTLSNLVKLIDRAGRDKPRIAQWADDVAAWFVLALLLFAVATFGFWFWLDGYSAARAWPIAIAVLVVSCPCALSLATPTALAAGTDRLLREGVLVTGAQTLETLHRASHIVFDKTGTLTYGRPVLQQTTALGLMQEEFCLQVAAALDAASAHPLARAIVQAAAEAGAADGALRPDWHPASLQELAGRGVEGVLHHRRYRLGNASFVAELSGSMPAHTVADGVTPVYLGAEGQWLACFALHDGIRAEAAGTIDYFRKAGKTVVLLSGDHDALARKVGDQLGISTTIGGYLPDEKLAFVKKLQEGGAVVAMVGDGINDAAVLSAADVSFAMGAGAALAQAHADAVLLSGRIDSVVDSAVVAGRTMGVIRQNLWWASLYNGVAIPAAALGWLNPWLSGVGMALSSAVVVANALRLRKGA
ncbi:heavy metal translocating P-type ATPase [Duganella qianjiadongensis]|uniref:Heavy metal translocating P-type ATPase n=1 Tax=Duganella qianjiadongensis TaxID=2692176 RepID=A0ABW9VSL0_9BURK|nr:heavy metal translocating P-type ATPase [Duganella qianjiadongensis]MYM41447.1 heavy metal translocating P-type ATPase [Duganella qianjiadongensis]